MAQPDFWQDRVGAEEKSRQLSKLKEDLFKWSKIEKSISDCLEIANLDKDDQTVHPVKSAKGGATKPQFNRVNLRKEIEKQFDDIERQLNDFEKLTFLNGKYDRKNAFLSIFAGAGGVDAQDWTEMLLRMYLRFAKKRGWIAQIIDQSKGMEAGIKSVTLEIKGEFVYGFLKSEAGVHRLVRISPFDAEKMRHTSFALVEILPEMEEMKIEINPEDLRVDTFLSSGPGGQNLQKNETAVRIVHIPTKITVSCQAERSQTQNKEMALMILKSKLFQYAQAEQEEEKARLRGEFRSASWGNQIRSYVLHPYKMVKDLRTRYETNEVERILNGDLDEMIESYFQSHKK